MKRNLNDALDFGRSLQATHYLQEIDSGASSDDIVALLDVSEVDADAQPKKVTLNSLVAAGGSLLKAGDTMTGVLGVIAGTAPLPGLAISGDPNTGVYSPGANQIAVATDGTQRVTVDTAATTSTLPVVHPLGAVGTPSITFTGNLNTGFWSPTADTLAASTAGSERFRITSAGVLQVPDAGDIAIGTTTGTKIGTATTQKIGFYNVTPVVQPAAVANATDATSVIARLNDLLARLRTLGIIAT